MRTEVAPDGWLRTRKGKMIRLCVRCGRWAREGRDHCTSCAAILRRLERGP